MILHGNCLEILLELPDHFDSIVCDPPYGMEFLNEDWDQEVPGPDYWLAAWYAAKPGAWLLAMGGTRTHHRLACAIEDAGWEIRDCMMWLHGEGFPKGPSTERAGMDGRGTCLKPAWEPILLARKPFKGTLLRNLESRGTGALNIDDCRVPVESADFEKMSKGVEAIREKGGVRGESWANDSDLSGANPASPLGRWPANVIMDEEAGAILDGQSGERPGMSGGGQHKPGYDGSMFGGPDGNEGHIRADTGGASRFFYCPKASRKEKEAGLDDFEAGTVDDGREKAADNAFQRGKTVRKNRHPTVKPVALMRYLVRMVTPPGGTVLDPFCGSGSTGIAAALEGRDFVGIDLDADYVALAEARITHARSAK